MLEFSKLSINNYFLFQKATFTFEQGLTRLEGENQSGKSLLFSSLLAGLFPSRQEDFKLPSASKFNFQFDSVADTKRVGYEFNIQTHKSSKYTILRNSKDLKPHKIADAQNLMREAFPIPFSVFSTTTYLRALKEHPLLQGGPSQRSEWLAKVLDIVTVYDDYYTQVKKQLDNLHTEAVKRSVLQEECDSLEMPKAVITKSEYTESSDKLSNYADKLNEATQDRIDVSNRLTMLTTLPDTRPIPQDLYRKAVKSLKIGQTKLAEIREYLHQWDDLEDVQHLVEKREKLKVKLLRLTDKPLTNKTLRSYITQLGGMQRDMEDYENALAVWKGESKIREFLAEKKAFKITSSLKDLKLSLAEKKERQSYITQHGKSLRKMSDLGDKCPTCGGKLDAKHVKTELRNLQVEWKALDSECIELDKVIQLATFREMPLVNKPKSPYTEKEVSYTETVVDILGRYLDIEVISLPTPEKSREDCEKWEEVNLKTIKACEHVIADYQEQASVDSFPQDIQDIYNKGRDVVKKAISNAKHRLEDLNERCSSLTRAKERHQIVVTSYDANRAQYSRMKKRRDELQEKLNDIDGLLKDIEPLKALLVAFGNSGLRLQQLKESADILSSKMTELSPIFFKHQYVFDMKVAYRKLNLDITRNGMTSGLATMSGSESRFFVLLFGMSLLNLLPHRLRGDTIILDEIDSMLDPNSRDRYAKDILPEVRQHVPKVIVVSPLPESELRLNADRRFKVVKSFKRGQWVSELIQN